MSVLAEEAEPADPIDPQRRSVKSATAFRTISEVSEELEVPQHVLRFWETKFPQVRPLKRGGGRRYYRPEDVELLRRVGQLLYHEGYTIKGVQRLLREGQIKPSKSQPTEATLPLGLEEMDPPPVIVEEEFDLTTAKRRRAVADEAMRAVLSELLDELLEIRDLLEPDHTEPV